jgi:hypothetical protein
MDGTIFYSCEIKFSDERDTLTKVDERKMDLVRQINLDLFRMAILAFLVDLLKLWFVQP